MSVPQYQRFDTRYASNADILGLMSAEWVCVDKTHALKIIKRLYPSSQSIRFIEHGYDNLVGLVDQSYVVRFLRSEEGWQRSQYEKQILDALAGVRSVQIPKILDDSKDPAYTIMSFLHGEHLAPAVVRAFSEEDQKRFAEDVATFAFEMHSLLSVEEAKVHREQLNLDNLKEKPWKTHLEEYLLNYTFPNHEQDRFAKEVYKKWEEARSQHKTVVVHDDLHNENMLFDGTKLTGVLDFGDTNIGTPEQEFRQLYRINENVVLAATNKYSQLSGIELNTELIKIWAIAHEASTFAEHLALGSVSHPSFSRAAKNLSTWHPAGDWNQGLKTTLESLR